ncbi:MAG TPA: CHAT domain-containing protein, partial [Blastocatellia bacterium]|nr:CHAT domain-containing protein [Blastocatellia bacterium]
KKALIVVDEGKPAYGISERIGGGDAIYYELPLRANWYVRLTLNQISADLAITLIGPDQRVLRVVDKPDGVQGIRYLPWLSTKAGSYTVIIRSKDSHALIGDFELSVEVPTPATEANMNFIQGDMRTCEGWNVMSAGTDDAMRQAIKLFAEAAPYRHASEPPELEADNFMYWGLAYHNLSEYQKAIEYYLQAVPLYRRAWPHGQLGWALNQIGSAYRDMGNPYKALEYYQQTLDAYKSVTDNGGIAIAYTSIGSAYVMLGDKQKAIDNLDQALYYWRAQKDLEGEARVHYRRCELYLSLGDGVQAQRPCEEAQRLWRLTGEKARLAMALDGTGRVFLLLGDKQKAFDCFTQALQERSGATDRRGGAYTQTYLGLLYYSQGDLKQAMQSLNKALSIFEEIGDHYGEARARNYIGLVNYSNGDRDKATENFEKSLVMRREAHDIEGQAESLYNIARIKRDKGYLDEARKLVESSLELVETVRSSVADEELRASYLATVQDYFEFYTDLLMRLQEQRPAERYDLLALHSVERARARSLVEILAKANVSLGNEVDPKLLAHERELRTTIRSRMEHNAQQYGRISGRQFDTIVGELAQLSAEYLKVKEQIRQINPRYADLMQPKALTAEQVQRQLLADNSVLLEYALGVDRGFLWVVGSHSIESFVLPKKQEIEELSLRVYSLLTEHNKEMKDEPPEQRQLRLGRTDAEYRFAAAKLSQMLLGPARKQIISKKLLIVVQGVLQFIPFSALPEPTNSRRSVTTHNQSSDDQPLIVNHEITMLPSASTLGVLRRDLANRKRAPRTVAVLADPVFSATDERLLTSRLADKSEPDRISHNDDLRQALRDVDQDQNGSQTEHEKGRFRRLFNTRWEAEQISSLTGPENRLCALDFSANLNTATSPDLSEYRILHFATHALLDNVHPESSGVVLSLVNEKGESQDGFLLARDIYNLKLPADLVVLSACRTGLGKDVRGEGLINLTRAFFYAGAGRVVVSLWSVDDVATSELMAKFYRHMLGPEKLLPTAALREAQIDMWRSKKWAFPYNWACFIIEGEPH